MKINKIFTTDNKYFATKINATRFGDFSKSTNTPSLKYKLELFLSYYSFTIQRYMKFQPGVDTFSATFSNRSQSNWIFILLNFAALLHYTCQLNEFLFKLGCLAKLPQKKTSESQIAPGILPVKREELFYWKIRSSLSFTCLFDEGIR